MKRVLSVLVTPLATRLGSLAAGAVGGGMAVDPGLMTRLEAWLSAGAFLAVDYVIYWLRAKPMEGR